MNADEAVALLQRMHGAALHCVVGLLIGHFLKGLDLVTDGNLCAWSGKSQDTVNKGMTLLMTIRIGELALVERLGINPNRWRLTGAGRQRLLPLAELLKGGETPFKTESLPMYVGVVDSNSNTMLTTPTTNKPGTPLLAESASNNLTCTPDWDTARAVRLLLRLDVWPNRARDVARGLEGDDYVNLRDLLGWIVYCRDPRRKIGNAAAVVCANLQARQRVGERYRARAVCGACRKVEGFCTCDAPDFALPEEFDGLAFSDSPLGEWGLDDWLRSLWFCPECGGRPCVCPERGQDFGDA